MSNNPSIIEYTEQEKKEMRRLTERIVWKGIAKDTLRDENKRGLDWAVRMFARIMKFREGKNERVDDGIVKGTDRIFGS